eukprot:TRINITY_DN4013_c0_g1_i1.p2 TRINITY_DN4013_c0_g1~~TRINITY_DN4013_c0_g1_i1.p2  ORF type:complete len:340 (+),score=109.30 TRINITY_DN4013_c0_g1_i1:354-1373(+)
MDQKELSREDAGAWMMNVLSCVSIIMVNKQLMSSSGYGFNFATSLSGMHFIVTGAASWLLKQYLESQKPKLNKDEAYDNEKEKKRSLPLTDLIVFVIVANVSIVSLNASLMINNVSLYQIAKLGIPPVTAVVERVWLGNMLTPHQLGAMCLTLVGIGLVTVAEFNVAGDTFGVGIALLSVVSSASQQILCGYYQRKNTMSSNDFLNAVSTWQGIVCLSFGPFVDYFISSRWLSEYEFTHMALLFLVLSCLNAVLVNASHFMCLGRFSAVSYQILGHTKTILVLSLGYYFFDKSITSKQVFGGVIAIMGMAAYGYYTQKRKADPPLPSPRKTPEDGKEEV